MITCFGGDGSLFKERTCVTPPSSCKGVVGGDDHPLRGRGAFIQQAKQKMPESAVEDSRNKLPCREQKVRGRKLIAGHLQGELFYFWPQWKIKQAKLTGRDKERRRKGLKGSQTQCWRNACLEKRKRFHLPSG